MSKVTSNEDDVIFALGFWMSVLVFLIVLAASSGWFLYALNFSVVVFLSWMTFFTFLQGIHAERKEIKGKYHISSVRYCFRLIQAMAIICAVDLLSTGELANLFTAVVLFVCSYLLDRELPDEIPDDQ